MHFEWSCQYESDQYRSLKGLVNKGGYFASPAQAHFWNKNPDDRNKTNPFGVPQEEGQYTIWVEGYISGSYIKESTDGPMYGKDVGWGRRTRRKAWIFVMDEVGVVAMYTGRFSYNDHVGTSWPNEEKTECKWERDNAEAKATATKFAAENAARQKEIAEAKAASDYVGEVGDKKFQVVGTISFVKEFYSDYGMNYLNIIKDAGGNTIKYMGSKHLGESGSSIEMVAGIKAHEEYNGEKQTVVWRPRKIEVGGAE